MKFNHLCLLVGVLLVVLGLTVFAHAATCYDLNGNSSDSNFYNGTGCISFEPQTKSVCLEGCSTQATQINLINNSFYKKCFNFQTQTSNYGALDVSLIENQVCLNENESTIITLNVNSCGTDSGRYRTKVFDMDSNFATYVDFEVGTCKNFDGFRINEFDGAICQSEEKKFSIEVTNTSGSSKRIALSADNSMVLPYFEKKFVSLAGGERTFVNLVINTRNLPIDTYTVSLKGDAENYQINKNLKINIVDCKSIPKRTFSLNSPSVCFDVRKGQTLESQFSITNQSCSDSGCSTRERQFDLSISGMPAEISYNSVLLGLNETRSIPFTVLVPQDAVAGHQLLSINAIDALGNNNFSDSKELCLNVLGENNSSLVVKTQSKDIVWCSAAVFELELTNTGDFDSNFVLSTIDAPSGVSVSFSENKLIIQKGKSKTIFVVVSTSPNSKVGDNQWIVVGLGGAVNLSAKIYFNIKEKTSFEDLEILSTTKEVSMKGNSTSTYEIILRNNTEKTLKDVVVGFENIPADVNIESILIAELAPRAPVTISGIITAGDTNGYFTPSFVVSSATLLNKKSFGLFIEKNPQGLSLSALFGGFFGLGTSDNNSLLKVFLESVVLAIVIIVLLGVIIIVASIITGPKKKENWVSAN
ncbi:MAG: hypothetical protein WCW13_01590 [archaeon]|jgi:uncharacterized membrane protein